ncbi:MAG: glycosyl hydrolase [Propionicimonas sp.]|uniref:glycosyl hydrolase n=1 Tax=Propionicimonas sp. TaxID=1955623 RepID=UPI003D0B119F
MTRTPRRIAVALVLLMVTGCAAVPAGPATPSTGPTGSAPPAEAVVLPDTRVGSLVAGLASRTPKQLDATRLADGRVPPTNRWYSGLVFGDAPQPVFPLPLSFALTGDGFAFGLPTVAATADTISGGFAGDVTVGLGATRSVVATDDPAVVGIDSYAADGTRLGRTTIAEGSPFVSFVAAGATSLTVPAGFSAAGDVFVATIGARRYAFRAPSATVNGTRIDLAAGGAVTFWAVPEGHDPGELAPYATPVTGSTVTYSVGTDDVTTTLAYAGEGTAIARLPHQGTATGCDLGTYPSIYGPMTLCAGSSLTWTTPRTRARAALDLSGLDATRKASLAGQLRSDVGALPAFPSDTYYGGKVLQRTAMLLMVAEELGEHAQAATLASALDQQLSAWTQPQGCTQRESSCFVYDPEGKGVVGLTASFGSDEYNDHHFHYGYFLYAAAVLARYDPSVVARYAPVLDLLAADIGSAGNSYFPDRRTFDVYASHSWASGTAPFADGNNQESVSEAVNAWAGLSLWAQVSGDAALETEADWMLSLEAHDSSTYWLEPDLSAFPGYAHRITTLNWGGKRDYATWFSPTPAAKLGILLLPMSPTSTYLAGDADAIRANVSDAVGDQFDQAFGDYALMYLALADPDARNQALAAAAKLSDATLDDGLSRTYLLAWLYALG